MDFALARDYRSPARRTRCERINKAEERLEALTMKAFLTAVVSIDVLLSTFPDLSMTILRVLVKFFQISLEEELTRQEVNDEVDFFLSPLKVC